MVRTGSHCVMALAVLYFCSACGGGGGGGSGGGGAGQLPMNENVGLRPIEDFALLAELGGGSLHDEDVWVETHASVDMSAVNNDGFFPVANPPIYTRTYHYVDPVRFETVLAEVKGAGCLARMQFALVDGLATTLRVPGGDDYDIRVYLDDPDVPAVTASMTELVSGALPGFPQPLVGGELESAGGLYVNVALPFREYCRVAATGVPHFHALQFLRFPTAEGVTTHAGSTDLSVALQAYENAGQNPNPRLEETTLLQAQPVIGAHSSVTVWNLTQGGTILGLELRPLAPDTWTPELRQQTRLRVYYDGSASAAIDAPLGLLFGAGLEDVPVQSIAFGRRVDGTGYLYFPMPFAASCRVQIVNDSDTAVSFAATVRRSSRTPREPFGRLHAAHVVVPTPAVDVDVPVLQVTGRGRVVGQVEDIRMPHLAVLEGNPRVFVDGMRSPAVTDGGHETWWGTAWYGGAMDFTVQLPAHGYTVKHDDGGTLERSYYRVFLQDAIPYHSAIEMSFQHGPINSNAAEFSILTYYYHDDQPAYILTDTVNPGDAANESAHAYELSVPAVATTRTAVFEGRELFESTDDGYTVAGSSEFQAAILSDNRGVMLLRLSDPTRIETPQAAAVYVDDVYAGQWYQPHYNPAIFRVQNETRISDRERWLEDSFHIPAAFTTGKTAIAVRLVSAGHWTEYRYRVWTKLP